MKRRPGAPLKLARNVAERRAPRGVTLDTEHEAEASSSLYSPSRCVWSIWPDARSWPVAEGNAAERRPSSRGNRSDQLWRLESWASSVSCIPPGFGGSE
jgi:hypothetical protein